MTKIVIDCLGGDNCPGACVEGAITALGKFGDLQLILAGDEKEISEKLKASEGYEKVKDRIELLHAPEVITGEDKPTDAIRLKKNSSMMRSIDLLRNDESVKALVSTGATGSLVSAATIMIKRVRGIRRPAFCPVLPTMDGGIVGICDSGANVDIMPEQLLQFAILGGNYIKTVYGVDSPRVALLNIGTESEKGDDLRKEAYKLLESASCVNFAGNMESRDLLSGKYDLVVCDGFSGNVLVKATEGTALSILKRIKKDIAKKKKYMIGALFMKQMFMEEKEFFNYQNYGGSVLLGMEKTVVKGHGSSNAAAVAVCIGQAYKMTINNMNEKIAADLGSLLAQE
ncbi:MAG: phosphate acyltransferase PlsX [Clostridia bacterium]|nr:phosphate acyltransferase PlsX [Clostridia bacterium]